MADRLSQILEMPRDAIDIREPFARYGFKSQHAVQFCADLEQRVHRRIEPTLAYDYPNIAELARFLHSGNDAAPPSKRPGGPSPERPGGTDRDHRHRLPISRREQCRGILGTAAKRAIGPQALPERAVGRLAATARRVRQSRTSPSAPGRFFGPSGRLRSPVFRHQPPRSGNARPPAAVGPRSLLGKPWSTPACLPINWPGSQRACSSA